MSFTFHNKHSQRQTLTLGNFPLHKLKDGGMLPISVVLEDRIGTETALMWYDPTPFIHDLAAVRPFQFFVKTGLVHTSHGPLLFTLFHVPAPIPQALPFASVDCHINPFDPAHLAPWRDLARQTHWHVALVDGKGEVVDLFEFENTFRLGEALDTALEACAGLPHDDFNLAKAEFCQKYTPDDLFEL